MQNSSLKLEVSKLRWAVVGLRLGFITNSIINHLFPAFGVTAKPSGPFSITGSYTFHIFLLFLACLQVLPNALKLINVIELELQACWFPPQHTGQSWQSHPVSYGLSEMAREEKTSGGESQLQTDEFNSQDYPQALTRS